MTERNLGRPLVAGIDIGGTTIRAGLVTEEGEILCSRAWLTHDFPEPEKLIHRLADACQNMAEEYSGYTWIGTGIGAPNGNFFRGTIEFAPNLNWKGIVPLAAQMEEKTGKTCLLTNDANAGALGEMLFGGAKKMQDFLFITLGTGLGSGIVCGGRLIYGHDGFAGELGHVIVNPGGRLCGCGRRGCLETYCSASGLVMTYREIHTRQNPESFGKPQQVTAKHIYELAVEEDADALNAFDQFSRTLGEALANAVAMTSPEAIFLFGGLASAADLIIPKTKKYMEAAMLPIFQNKVQLLRSGLPENDAAILGAASLVWNQLKKS
jgi:glucokinase